MTDASRIRLGRNFSTVFGLFNAKPKRKYKLQNLSAKTYCEVLPQLTAEGLREKHYN